MAVSEFLRVKVDTKGDVSKIYKENRSKLVDLIILTKERHRTDWCGGNICGTWF